MEGPEIAGCSNVANGKSICGDGAIDFPEKERKQPTQEGLGNQRVSDSNLGSLNKILQAHLGYALSNVESSNKPDDVLNTSDGLSDCFELESFTNNQILERENENKIFLSTAIILVQDKKKNWRTCRALLDSASQCNFMTKRLQNSLKLSLFETSEKNSGINENESLVNG